MNVGFVSGRLAGTALDLDLEAQSDQLGDRLRGSGDASLVRTPLLGNQYFAHSGEAPFGCREGVSGAVLVAPVL